MVASDPDSHVRVYEPPDPPPKPPPEPPRCDTYDATNWACDGKCVPGSPPDACRPCPDPPDVEVYACRAVMPCPDPPDRRVKHCWPNRHSDGIELGRILAREPSPNGGIVITISIGSDHGIDATWHGTVLAGETEAALDHGELVWIRIDRVASKAVVQLTADQIEHNPHVRLTR